MTLRIFASDEDAVFEQIIKQREDKGPNEDYFIYFASKCQKELQSNGKAVQCGIGTSEQAEIIRRLTKDKILDADWIVSRNHGKINLMHHDEKWLQKNFSAFDLSIIVFDDWDYKDCFFIKLDFNRIKAINDGCRAIYLCELLYDEGQCCFCVKRKDTGEIYYINKLRKTMKPFKILLATFKSTHKHATRDWLNGNRETHIGKKSIATRAFAKNSVVRNELSPFVTLGTEDILIKTEAILTFDQLKALEKA